MKQINSYERNYTNICEFFVKCTNLKEYAFKKSHIKIFIKNEIYHKYI